MEVKIPRLRKNAKTRVGRPLTHPPLEKHEIEKCAGWNFFLDLFLGGSGMQRREEEALRLLDMWDFEELGWGL